MEYKTLNFQPMSADTEISENAEICFDKRNGIICVDPTLDVRGYYNYIKYLNLQYQSWVTYGYLDMGMVPISMLPSFYPSSMRDILAKFVEQLGVRVYAMPPVSHLKGSFKGVENDIWVFRQDLAEAIKVPEQKANLTTLLSKLMEFDRSK